MANRTARRPSENTEAESFDVSDEEFKDAPTRRKVNQRNEQTKPKTNTAKETNMNIDTSLMLKKGVKLLDGTKGVITKLLTGNKVAIKTEDGDTVKLNASELKKVGAGYKQIEVEAEQAPEKEAVDAAIGKKIKLLDGETGVIIKTLKTKFKIELDDGDSRLISHALVKEGKRFYTEIEEEVEEKEEKKETEETYIGKMVKLLDGETGEIVRELLKGKLSVKTTAGRVRVDSANLKQLANGNYKEMKTPVAGKEVAETAKETVVGEKEDMLELIKKLTRRVAKLEKALAE